ncbi:TM2 domain-containing protein 3-like [Choloepus didactylus]|uniref:TM2 domain-containing protein 3-like n=1 Tax=Choloepus didactylus TaxID=27675 RepID=UPI00189EC1BC|nr:TM2 domain-containing protein 3-like [Choloepus didactylus]
MARLCRVLLFVSQFYILSGGGSLNLEHSQPLAQSAKDPGPTRTFTGLPRAAESTEIPPYVMKCPSNGLCSRLPADCMECKTNSSCVYGKPVAFDCTVKPSVTCVDQDLQSQKNFVINMTCRFCWQLPEADYECSNSTSCMTVSCPRQRYTANCTVRDHIHCLGNRTFPKMLYCNWTGGYKWSTALALRFCGSEIGKEHKIVCQSCDTGASAGRLRGREPGSPEASFTHMSGGASPHGHRLSFLTAWQSATSKLCWVF